MNELVRRTNMACKCCPTRGHKRNQVSEARARPTTAWPSCGQYTQKDVELTLTLSKNVVHENTARITEGIRRLTDSSPSPPSPAIVSHLYVVTFSLVFPPISKRDQVLVQQVMSPLLPICDLCRNKVGQYSQEVTTKVTK
jgi:hypothetical protein